MSTELAPRQARTTKGVRTTEQAELDAEAARMRSRSMSYRQIGAAMGCDGKTAYDRVQRALRAIVQEPAEAVIKMELEKLDYMEGKVLAVLETTHYVTYHGVPTDVVDTAPTLAAAAKLREIGESRRKLLGLDAAQKVDLTGAVQFMYVGVNIDAV